MAIDRHRVTLRVPVLAAIALLAACSADETADEPVDAAGPEAAATADRVAAGRDKSIPCLACHGAEGMADHDVWPNLAGQHAEFLAKQLRDFRDGRRYDPWMSPMAIGLDDDDIDDLAIYFSQLNGVSGGTQSAPPQAITCVACHSERAGEANSLWPSLAGQNARYIVKQLIDFRAGRRVDPVMAPLAQPLSDADIAAGRGALREPGGRRAVINDLGQDWGRQGERDVQTRSRTRPGQDLGTLDRRSSRRRRIRVSTSMT